MCSLKLENSLFEYLLKILKEEKEEYLDIVDDSKIDLNIIRENILNGFKKIDDDTRFQIDDIGKTQLLQYVEDKQIAIGFVNQDYLNEDGHKLQKIYDEIYQQTN